MSTKMRSEMIIVCLALILGLSAQSYGTLLSDSPGTVTLLHMDALTGDDVLDDDSANPGRDHDLSVVGRAAGYTYLGDASITTGGLGLHGEAIQFNQSFASADMAWESHDDAYVDMWVKFNEMPTTVGAPDTWVMYVSGTWDIYMSANDELTWKIYNQSASKTGYLRTVPLTSRLGEWMHITASYADLATTLTVDDDISLSGTTDAEMRIRDMHVTFGSNPSKAANRAFVGLMDEVKVSSVPEPTTLVLLGLGVLACRGRGKK